MVSSLVKRTENSQSIAADVNELLFGYYLTDSWDDFEESRWVKTEYYVRSKKITEKELRDQDGRAQKQAEKLKDWMNDNRYDTIVKKWWPKQNSQMISQAVGYEVDLDKNPIDLLIKTSKNQFLGISAKSGKGRGRIPFKNKGLGTVEKELNIDLKHIYENEIKKLLNKHPKLPKIQKERKVWFKKNEDFYKKNISKSGFVKNTFSGIRDRMLDKLHTFSSDKLWEYIRDCWIDAGKIKPRYIIVIGRGTFGKYDAIIEDPLEITPQNLSIEQVGSDKIRVYWENGKLVDMRVKFESTQMATSIKFSGD
jgi:hypothetical protein